jgi:hypothetical protein
LNERKEGSYGPWWQSWRAWLHFDWNRKWTPCFGIEWNCWPISRPGFSVGFELCGDFGQEHDLAGRIHLGRLCAFYWHAENLFPKWLRDRIPPAREFKIEIYEEFLWVEFAYFDPSEHWGEPSRGWGGVHLSWDWKTALMGKMQFKEEKIGGSQLALIPLPEANYLATFQVERCTWRRSRWPWSRRPLVRVSTDIRIPDGLPVPDKRGGDDDAIMGTGSSETELPAVIAHCVKRVLEDRARYATIDWQPRSKVKA